jgi:hypothetical protein
MTDINKTIEEAKSCFLLFESWERLTGETGAAYAVFCAYRDYEPERNIRRAVQANEKDKGKREKRYGMWRNCSTQFRWQERAADYDRYLDRLKQMERRKAIAAQEGLHRPVTGKMLAVVEKQLVLMNPADLSQGAVTEWVETVIRVEPKQGEINSTPDFNGL